MSTVQVGDIELESSKSFHGGQAPNASTKPFFLSMDYTEAVLCVLLGITILRCFYARICNRSKSQKDKEA